MSAVAEAAPPPTPALPAPPRFSTARLSGLVAVPLALASLAWGGAIAVHDELKPSNPPPSRPAEPDGPALFARHCAYCHGHHGDGKGIAQLDPRARAFGLEKFKLATTTNGIPTDEDLLAVLHRGIPGSAMPAFGELRDDELRAILDQIRLLTRGGLYAELKRKAEMSDDDVFDPVKTTKRVAELTAVGPRLDPFTPKPATPDSIARGKAIFLGKEAACSSCHGEQGRGDGPQGLARLERLREKAAKNESLAQDEKDLLRESQSGALVLPRNLTNGVFKGGRDPANIYARIRLGIPGVLAMPAAEKLPPEDVKDLVNFVLSLSPTPAIPQVGPRGGQTAAR